MFTTSCFGNKQIFYSEYGMPFEGEIKFKKQESGNIIHDGVEYAFVKNDGTSNIDSFGIDKRIGNIAGDPDINENGLKCVIGLYSLKNDKNLDIMVYITPDAKWLPYYVKVGTELNFSLENCERFEYFSAADLDKNTGAPDPKHGNCNDGITSPEDLRKFKDKLAESDDLKNSVEDIDIPTGYIYGFIPGCNYMMLKMEVYGDIIKCPDGKCVEIKDLESSIFR